jgi:hypothetical protein
MMNREVPCTTPFRDASTRPVIRMGRIENLDPEQEQLDGRIGVTGMMREEKGSDCKMVVVKEEGVKKMYYRGKR